MESDTSISAEARLDAIEVAVSNIMADIALSKVGHGDPVYIKGFITLDGDLRAQLSSERGASADTVAAIKRLWQLAAKQAERVLADTP